MKGPARLVIRHGIGPTRLGPALIGVTDRGVCYLSLLGTEHPAVAVKELRRHFPEADLVETPAAIQPVLRQLDAVLAGEATEAEVALDLHGTRFQLAVWRAVRQVPRGSTCSYSELARRIHKPRAARAVGSACARSPVALLIPCHRILHRDGRTGSCCDDRDHLGELLRWERGDE